MRRRQFIAGLAGAAAWPLAARAQQPDRVRRIGVLMNIAAYDPNAQDSVATFVQMLQQLGWTEGRNLRIDIRWAGGDAAEICRHAADLVAFAPDVIVSTGTAGMGPLLQATRTVPIVFANVADPVGAGFIDSLAALRRELERLGWAEGRNLHIGPFAAAGVGINLMETHQHVFW
jgi:putative ABC transport system substrate-binding protein